MRGKGFFSGCKRIFHRITPAGAGKRKRNRRSNRQRKDHPCGCGEKVSHIRPRGRNNGSPPRVRGKGFFSRCKRIFHRITPAGAGKSAGDGIHYPADGDHPRGCGEKFDISDFSVLLTGSPPRVRGKVKALLCQCANIRITPAGAGKSCVILLLSCGDGDHPRGCGEKSSSTVMSIIVLGSPPRVRGKGCFQNCFCRVLGITPAGAGKRTNTITGELKAQDHPRGCGEKP